MCSFASFIPHRERKPLRYCKCGTLLASPNETSSCFQCSPSWSPSYYLRELLSTETQEGFAALMAEPPSEVAA